MLADRVDDLVETGLGENAGAVILLDHLLGERHVEIGIVVDAGLDRELGQGAFEDPDVAGTFSAMYIATLVLKRDRSCFALLMRIAQRVSVSGIWMSATNPASKRERSRSSIR